MSTLSVLPGSIVELQCAFTNAAGAAAAPTTVVLRLLLPSGTVQTPAVTADAPVGTYHVDVTVPAAAGQTGPWHWRWEGTGAVVAPAEGYFTVLPSAFVLGA